MNKRKLKAGVSILFIIGLFIFASYLVQSNMMAARGLVSESGFFGVVFYIFLMIAITVIAPLSSLPLIPVLSNVWGWFYAGVYSAIGWFIGAYIIFILARKYGKPLVEMLVSLEEVEEIQAKIPKKNTFLGLVFFRMAVPVDVLSYALALFTDIDEKTYVLTTFIGVIPFAFVFSYLGTLPVIFQLIGFFIGFFILLFGLFLDKFFKV